MGLGMLTLIGSVHLWLFRRNSTYPQIVTHYELLARARDLWKCSRVALRTNVFAREPPARRSR